MPALLLLLVGLALVLYTALLVASWLSSGSIVEVLLGTYIIAFAEIVLVTLVLSPAGWLRPWTLLVSVATVLAAVSVATRRHVRWPLLYLSIQRAAVELRAAARDPVLLALGVVVFAASIYTIVLVGFTPQNSDDALYYHLLRAAFWKQHHGVGYSGGPWDHSLGAAADTRVNADPPNAEIGMLFTMVLGRSGRYTGYVQLAAYFALILGTVGVGRRAGLTPDQALYGGLTVATLPVILLQAGAALNDVVAASFIVAAICFALASSPSSSLLAALAAGLALGTKIPALIGLPLVGIAAMGEWSRRGLRRAIIVLAGSLVVGSYWYLFNLVETGRVDGGVIAQVGPSPSRSLLDILARVDRLAVDIVDIPGASGRDRFVYAIAAALIVVALTPRLRLKYRSIGLAPIIALAPLSYPFVRNLADRTHFKLWSILGRPDLAALGGHKLTESGTLNSWYGPLLLIVGLPAIVIAWRRRRLGTTSSAARWLTVSPIYGIVALAVVMQYQVLKGRYLLAEVALAASAWGVVLRIRALAWATVAIALATVVLTLVNNVERPAGVRLLEPARTSIWTEPQWLAQTVNEPALGPALAYVDAHVPRTTTLALVMGGGDVVYPFFAPDLRRRIVFPARSGAVPRDASWLAIRPGAYLTLCTSAWQSVFSRFDWRILRRRTQGGCSGTVGQAQTR